MKKVGIINIALIWLIASCGCAENVARLQPRPQTQPQPQPEQGVEPFLFEYSYSEVPPNPGNGANKRRKFIKIGLKGEYEASDELIATRGHLGYSYKKSGTLTAGQLARMAQIIEKLELPSIGYSELYLARGGEAEFGWGGHITYMQDGKSYNVKFTSQQSRTQQLDATLTARFLTFMGDMDSFFQEEISF